MTVASTRELAPSRLRLAKTSSRAFVLAGSVLLFAAGLPTAIGVPFETVAVGGQAAPGAGGGSFNTTLSTFSNPLINALGEVSFTASLLQGGSVTTANDTGLWSGLPSALGITVREGTTAPGAGAAVFGPSVLAVTHGNAGHLAFRANLTGTGVVTSGVAANTTGLWSGMPGSLGLLARENGTAPGLGGPVFAVGGFTSASIAVTPSGTTGFFANLRTSVGGVTASNDRTLWTGTPGAITMIAREGSAAPGTVGANFNVLGSGLAMNEAGKIAFTASLTGGDTTVGVNSGGLWLGDASSVTLVARNGDVAPNAGGATYASILTPTISASGAVMFRGSLTGAGIDSTNDTGLWSGLPGSISPVARKGDAAPGVLGSTFDTVGLQVRRYAGNDRVVFDGAVTDGVNSKSGLWHGEPGSITKIAVTGDNAPDTGGALFASTFAGVATNGLGQVAFTSALTGAGVDLTNDLGLFAADPFGGLILVLRKGDLFDVNNDVSIADMRTISDIRLAGGSSVSDGLAAAFNNSGQLAFQLYFTDNTSAVVVTTIPIPAPGAAASLVLASMLLTRRRR